MSLQALIHPRFWKITGHRTPEVLGVGLGALPGWFATKAKVGGLVPGVSSVQREVMPPMSRLRWGLVDGFRGLCYLFSVGVGVDRPLVPSCQNGTECRHCLPGLAVCRGINMHVVSVIATQHGREFLHSKQLMQAGVVHAIDLDPVVLQAAETVGLMPAALEGVDRR